MKIDIIVVTYNSKKWLNGLISSIENQAEVDLSDLNLYFVDNVSNDGTIEELEKYKQSTKLGSFEIIKNNKNLGFGKANNLGFKKRKIRICILFKSRYRVRDKFFIYYDKSNKGFK